MSSDRFQYAIKVAHPRGDKKFWHVIGTAFFNPARDDYQESIALRLNSMPPVGLECRAFPMDDQEPIDCDTARFNLVVKCERSDGGTHYHTVGSAFYNPPRGEFSENFNLRFDSIPLVDDVRGYPPREQQDDAAEESAA